MGPASEVEIFHHLRGETVTSIITEKTATARENNNTHTQHRPTVNLQGVKELTVQPLQQQQKSPVCKLRGAECATINRENVKISLQSRVEPEDVAFVAKKPNNNKEGLMGSVNQYTRVYS